MLFLTEKIKHDKQIDDRIFYKVDVVLGMDDKKK